MNTSALLLYVIDIDPSNEQVQYAINVPSGATVARAKAAFLRAQQSNRPAKSVGLVEFSFHGELLSDERPLLSYDMRSNDIIHNVPPPPTSTKNQGNHGTSGSRSGLTYYLQLDRQLALSKRRTAIAPPRYTTTQTPLSELLLARIELLLLLELLCFLNTFLTPSSFLTPS